MTSWSGWSGYLVTPCGSALEIQGRFFYQKVEIVPSLDHNSPGLTTPHHRGTTLETQSHKGHKSEYL
ncbi:hypothetical protein PROFUN_02975 [Planoprotostelium fungivorum]|uniref:Uncharacterized protein n=1 Tax=Planoprotostelium fungivorum TaxID=1890364 RepID=A0A2P6NX71_9EUKA|nr:hypothetical protein PROFUN_02975 [Planoprotostelium fungivorum]